MVDTWLKKLFYMLYICITGWLREQEVFYGTALSQWTSKISKKVQF